MKAQLWRKTNTYLYMIGIFIGILFLEILVITILDKMNLGEHINDTIAISIIILICLPGIIVGITGAIICSFKKK